MLYHKDQADQILVSLIRKKQICLGGNQKLKIFGTLNCRSGKRMLRKNRVFFFSEKEALAEGYRPCGHCMKDGYKKWKETHGPI